MVISFSGNKTREMEVLCFQDLVNDIHNHKSLAKYLNEQICTTFCGKCLQAIDVILDLVNCIIRHYTAFSFVFPPRLINRFACSEASPLLTKWNFKRVVEEYKHFS